MLVSKGLSAFYITSTHAFDFKDVADFFDYIWYPSADDIILFDESYKVCFMVRHDGAVYQFDKK